MKVKLTETQFNVIKLIKEAEDAFEMYKKLCSDSLKKVNDYYLKIANSSISEFLDMSINADGLNSELSKIEDNIYNMEKKMLNMYESGMIGQGIEDFEDTIENMASSVVDRITSLSIMLNYLDELQYKNKEYNLTRHFKNVKPLDIQSF